MAAVCFAAGGIALIAQQAWSRPAVVVAALCSTLIYLASWDGSFSEPGAKGAVGILLNIAVVLIVLLALRPAASAA